MGILRPAIRLSKMTSRVPPRWDKSREYVVWKTIGTVIRQFHSNHLIKLRSRVNGYTLSMLHSRPPLSRPAATPTGPQ